MEAPVRRYCLALGMGLGLLFQGFQVLAGPEAQPVTGTVSPVHDRKFQRYVQRYYGYDRTLPLNAEIASTHLIQWNGKGAEVRPEKKQWMKLRSWVFRQQVVTFDSTNGQRIRALLTLPHEGSPPYPCVLLLHGYNDDKESGNLAGMVAGRQGWAALALDAMYHGERAVPGHELYSPLIFRTRQGIIQTIVDWRRAIDYVASRPDLNEHRLGLVGGSMGAIMGAILAGVDPRVSCAVLGAGGADWGVMASQSQNQAAQHLRTVRPELTPQRVAEVLAPVDPIHYVGRISPRPLLILHGNFDESVPPDAARLLWQTARQPKEMRWYQAGHYLPKQAFLYVVEWLKKHL